MDSLCRTIKIDRRTPLVKSVLHAIDVLDALHAAARPLGVSDIARRAGLSKSAAYNILITLESCRLVEQDPVTTTWRVSWRLYEFGAGMVGEVDLARLARIHIDRLTEQTRETALLGVLSDDEVLYLDKSDAFDSVHMLSRPGRRSPLHCWATGKIILAFSGEELLARVLSSKLIRRTPRTIRYRQDRGHARQGASRGVRQGRGRERAGTVQHLGPDLRGERSAGRGTDPRWSVRAVRRGSDRSTATRAALGRPGDVTGPAPACHRRRAHSVG